MQTPEQIKTLLAGYYCTEAYHYTATSRAANVFYTDGVKRMMELCEAYWLIHAISSHQQTCQKDEKEMLPYMQFWTLTVNTSECTAVLTCERDSGDVAIQQNIEFTNFPLAEMKVWLELGMVGDRVAMVAMLPGER